jgi:hypothetical protein
MIEESQTAYGRATSEHSNLGAKYQNKTVATDGEKTLSGWQGKTNSRPEGFSEVTPEQVSDYSSKIGHDLKPHILDQKSSGGWSGKYNASHAEKQLAILRPGEPIAVSEKMCPDCVEFFQKHAQYTGKPQIVTDPTGTRIFHPDGSFEIL